jgi:uncharacterized lipoprotein YbaY
MPISLLILLLVTRTAIDGSITGTATYRERIAMPPNAVFEAVLEDVSRAGAAAEEIARTRVQSPGNVPIRFAISYDPGRIQSTHTYGVRARILVDEKVMFTTDTAYRVLTRGNPSHVSVIMRRVGSVGTGGARSAKGRFKKDGSNCVWDANDTGPDQCKPNKGRFKKDGNRCLWDPNDSGPNQCNPRQPR